MGPKTEKMYLDLMEYIKLYGRKNSMGPTPEFKIVNNSVYGLTQKEMYENMISTTLRKANYRYPNPTKFFYDPESGVAVIIWDDGDKTVVKPAKDENIDIYDSFCAAFCKKIYGTNSSLKRNLNDILVIKEKKEKKKKK